MSGHTAPNNETILSRAPAFLYARALAQLSYALRSYYVLHRIFNCKTVSTNFKSGGQNIYIANANTTSQAPTAASKVSTVKIEASKSTDLRLVIKTLGCKENVATPHRNCMPCDSVP